VVEPAESSHQIAIAECVLLLQSVTYQSKLQERVHDISSISSLSKFGVEARICILSTLGRLLEFVTDNFYLYSKTNSYKYVERASVNEAMKKKHRVLSCDVESSDGY